EEELRPVRHPDRDLLAGLQPERTEPGRGAVDLVLERREAPAPPAKDERLARTVALRQQTKRFAVSLAYEGIHCADRRTMAAKGGAAARLLLIEMRTILEAQDVITTLIQYRKRMTISPLRSQSAVRSIYAPRSGAIGAARRRNPSYELRISDRLLF